MATPIIPDLKAAKRFYFLVFSLFTLIYLLTTSGTFDVPDAIPPYRTAKAIIEERKFDLNLTEPMDLLMTAGDNKNIFINIYFKAKDGKIYSKYGMLATLQMLPFVLLGKLLFLLFSGYTGLELLFFEKFACSAINVIPTALSCVLLIKLSRRIGFPYSTSFVMSIIFGLGTMVWTYSQAAFTEPLLMLFLMGLVYFLTKANDTGSEIDVIYAALFMAAMIHVKVSSCLVLPIACLYVLYISFKLKKFKFLFLFYGIVAISVLLLLNLNQVRFSHPLETGYGREITGIKLQQPPNRLLAKIVRFSLSIEKGFFAYNLVLIPALFGLPQLFRKQKTVFILAVSVFLTYLIGVSLTRAALLEAWGPRYLILGIPLLTLPIGYLIQRHSKVWNVLLCVFFSAALCINLASILVFHSEYQYLKYGFGHSLQKSPFELRNDIAGAFTVLKHKIEKGDGIYKSSEFGMTKPGENDLTMATYRYPMFVSFNLWFLYINVRSYNQVPWIIIIPCIMLLAIALLFIKTYRVSKALDGSSSGTASSPYL